VKPISRIAVRYGIRDSNNLNINRKGVKSGVHHELECPARVATPGYKINTAHIAPVIHSLLQLIEKIDKVLQAAITERQINSITMKSLQFTQRETR
jgi:hypothetical protein